MCLATRSEKFLVVSNNFQSSLNPWSPFCFSLLGLSRAGSYVLVLPESSPSLKCEMWSTIVQSHLNPWVLMLVFVYSLCM